MTFIAVPTGKMMLPIRPILEIYVLGVCVLRPISFLEPTCLLVCAKTRSGIYFMGECHKSPILCVKLGHYTSSAITTHHAPSLCIIHHHLASFTITRHHLPTLDIIHYHQASFVDTRHHSPSLCIIHHH